ncbi:hypothetical protein EATA6166_45290 (plasmid) [Enterobacter asburiae]|uniref:Csu type fimbrial protein n=1 Tax=Enterobacter asburiae TaxID=61645 RepID=UPI000DBAFE07|nr:spore coat U domain-containing protein [Enterobacter asburiae]BBJ60975.1 hypothetical protein EAS17NKHM_p10830 [Enterobacter asburiae]BBJ61007.1 hypothetical protein EAS17NKHM_p11150 [Enterobacter asburiae]BEK76605.1 hypothetical protein EATA6166_44970 [Enterobacter asburiae]BEK76637.1 hypothetical protein EATA6166_45290 [Enterobacter asburiae]HEB5890332.1 spore coat protein U domain-containing protein [Enterobacter asburiae]
MISFYSLRFFRLLIVIFSLPVYGGNITCKAEISDFDFGNIVTGQPLSKQSAYGYVKFSCTNRDIIPLYVGLCLNRTPSSKDLTIDSLSDKDYSIIFRDRATGLPWSEGNPPIHISRIVNARTDMTEKIPISAEMHIDPITLSAGPVNLRFTLQSPSLSWYASSVPFSDSCTESLPADQISFNVRANITKRCDVIADSLDFGKIIDMSGSKIFSQSTINIKCTNETIYSVSLRSLNGSSTGFMMNNGTNNKIPYALFKDSAKKERWAEGLNAKIDRGTGKWQQHQLYGQVNLSPSDEPSSGDYADTVIISINY